MLCDAIVNVHVLHSSDPSQQTVCSLFMLLLPSANLPGNLGTEIQMGTLQCLYDHSVAQESWHVNVKRVSDKFLSCKHSRFSKSNSQSRRLWDMFATVELLEHTVENPVGKVPGPAPARESSPLFVASGLESGRATGMWCNNMKTE